MSGGEETGHGVRRDVLIVLALVALAATSGSFALALSSGLVGAAALARTRPATAVIPGAEGEGADAMTDDVSAAAMRASLRRLEAELHALEDQRLTELAGEHGG